MFAESSFDSAPTWKRFLRPLVFLFLQFAVFSNNSIISLAAHKDKPSYCFYQRIFSMPSFYFREPSMAHQVSFRWQISWRDVACCHPRLPSPREWRKTAGKCWESGRQRLSARRKASHWVAERDVRWQFVLSLAAFRRDLWSREASLCRRLTRFWEKVQLLVQNKIYR